MIYLDNAASSHPKPEAVYEAVNRALRIGANPGRSGHRTALDAARVILETRELLARLIGATGSGGSGRICFTYNATHAINLGLRGLLLPGDHVVSSSMEHNSLSRPLHALGTEGISVSWVKGDEAGRIDPQAVEDAIGRKTRLVALSHASNVCGTLLDVEAVVDVCRRNGVWLLLDGSQTAGVVEIDVEALGVDLFAAPGHKGLLGPQGTGFLYVAPNMDLKPLLHGGTGFDSESPTMPMEMPERLEAGTLNTPGLAGLAEGVKYLLERTVADVRAHELGILKALLPRLRELEGLTLYGPDALEERVAVVSFNMEGKDGARVGLTLDERYDIAVRVGLHCAPDAHKTLGTFPAGTVRAGFGPFNTLNDAEQLVSALDEIQTLRDA